MLEFKSFEKIQPIGKLRMNITQKIHGTNAQVYIYQSDGKLGFKVGSRSRWITPENDNYGFANFVYQNQEEFLEKLGLGLHFGEWAGPGINSGEGLKQKTFCLFNIHKWRDQPLPTQCCLVPHLYHGEVSLEMVNHVFEELKTNGSKLIPGFMSPEGIVVEIDGKRYKKVFQPEETGWTSKHQHPKVPMTQVMNTVDHLLQPIRLEKLLSRDEEYLRNFPHSLSKICQDYVGDLEIEDCLPKSPDELATTKRALGRHIFSFVKQQIVQRNCNI